MAYLTLNPWQSLWWRPRQTFRRLLDEAPGYNVMTLAALSGVATALGQASGHGLSSQMSLWLLLPVCLLLGPLLGWAELWIGSWLLARIGHWLGGDADSAELRTVMAWSGLPNVFGLLVWLMMTLQQGQALFLPRTPEQMTQLSAQPGFVILAGLQLILGFWSLWLLWLGVAEAQHLSWPKALLNLLLTAMAVLILLSPLRLLFEHLR